MSLKLSIITCTGDRPEAFALAEKYVARQTRQPDQWLVYDDGMGRTKTNMSQEYTYCPQYNGRASLSSKLHHAFSTGRVTGDACAFVEDDDYYHPNYLEHSLKLLESGFDMVGEGMALYYNVRYRVWNVHSNMQHASLCQTMVRANQYAMLARRCLDPDPFLDGYMWRNFVCRKLVYPPCTPRLLIGIKGMPGRKGYGVGHQRMNGNPDPNLKWLTSFIGAEDAEAYAKYKA